MQSDNPTGAGRPGVDILDLLKRDHRRVDHLLDQLEATDTSDERRRAQLFAQVTAEIEVHSDAEDQVVYGCFEGREGLEDLVEDMRQQHEHIEQMVEELDQTEVIADDWIDKLRELRQLVSHHVDEEEGALFGRIREALDAGARERLGEDFIMAKASEEAEVSLERAATVPDTDRDPGDMDAADDLGERDIESLSKKELYDLARNRHIEGRSAMTKAELVVAIRAAR
jgi:hemerythrin-like domain-containing protein